ncbi:hypothetical protein J6590_006174 [Homalodisca vitripennis]|nr:hypothetical protein J6590_006174 [Homalodisca vitripennis]
MGGAVSQCQGYVISPHPVCVPNSPSVSSTQCRLITLISAPQVAWHGRGVATQLMFQNGRPSDDADITSKLICHPRCIVPLAISVCVTTSRGVVTGQGVPRDRHDDRLAQTERAARRGRGREGRRGTVQVTHSTTVAAAAAAHGTGMQHCTLADDCATIPGSQDAARPSLSACPLIANLCASKSNDRILRPNRAVY